MTLPNDDTLDTYGGICEDYGIGKVDALTDRSSDEINKMLGNVAMMTRTAIRAMVEFIAAGDNDPPITPVRHMALWGSSTLVRPSIVWSAVGTFDITWPVQVVPENQEAAIPLAIQFVLPVAVHGSSFRKAHADRLTANSIRVYTMDAAGALQDFVGTSYGIFWR